MQREIWKVLWTLQLEDAVKGAKEEAFFFFFKEC